VTLLAFVTYTALHHADVVFVTSEPVECTRAAIELTLEWFDQHGVEMMAQCEYTSAPATTIRPEARP
jgi:hypothetical protein